MLAFSRLQTIICTSRLTEAESFYGEVLALPLKGRSHGGLIYDVGGSDLLVAPVPSTEPSEHTRVRARRSSGSATLMVIFSPSCSTPDRAGGVTSERRFEPEA
jgi:hypothetical protein